MCEYVGVGVRDLATAAIWLDGGGVMLPIFVSAMRLAWSASTAAGSFVGRSECAGCGVMGAGMARER